MLDGSTGTGAKLHLIEYYQRMSLFLFYLTWGKLLPEVKLQIHEKHVKVVQIKVKKLHHFRIYLAEVHQNVRHIFFTRKFFHNIAFPYTPGSLYQKGCITLMVFLPFQQFIVYLPSHNSRIRPYCVVDVSPIQDYLTYKSTLFLGFKRTSRCFYFNYFFDIATLKDRHIVPHIYIIQTLSI